jgi:cyclic pyranopterin phosphate synthase
VSSDPDAPRDAPDESALARHIFDIIRGYISSELVFVAARLQLADHIAAGARLSGELAEHTGRVQVPYLRDPNTATEMYESDAILAYLDRINVSLDTLSPDRFRKITQRGELQPVLEGLAAAKAVGMDPIKVNAVIIRGFNDDELLDLVEFGRHHHFEMRLIEYMDVGNASGWTVEKTFSKREMLETIHARFPVREVGRASGSAPAVDYEFVDGAGQIGIIGSVTEPFCSSCTRARLTADGKLVTCLFAETGIDLKTKMRQGAPDEELSEIIRTVWTNRADRYSDLRWERLKSGAGYEPRAHKKIEMITLGG